MKYLTAILLLLSWPAQACTITISAQTTTPSQNISKTFTDTDANCVLALQAMQSAYTPPGGSPPTAAQAFTIWAQTAIGQLITMTTNYQRNNAALTPINPQ